MKRRKENCDSDFFKTENCDSDFFLTVLREATMSRCEMKNPPDFFVSLDIWDDVCREIKSFTNNVDALIELSYGKAKLSGCNVYLAKGAPARTIKVGRDVEDNTPRRKEKAMSKEKQSEWISMEERLPNEGEEVLIYAGEIGVAKLVRGIGEEERRKMKNGEIPDPTEHAWSLSTGWREIKRSDIYRAEDEGFNNLKPFRFVGNGNAQWCGQNVTHWMPLPKPPEEDILER